MNHKDTNSDEEISFDALAEDGGQRTERDG